jgi:putative ABC transport system substrate-binding protein
MAVVFLFTGCNKSRADYEIDVLQLVTHPALDKAFEGFREELTALITADGKTVAFHLKNANGEEATCTTIANQFKASKSDLVLAIATPAAQAAASAITDKPILFTAVTDAVAAGLVDTNEYPRHNVSGTSDDNRMVKEQLELIKMLVPGIAKIAFIYNTAEVNSEVQLTNVTAKAGELSLEVVPKPVTDLNDIEAAINSIGNDVGAIYLPTDNLIASAAENVHAKNKARSTPLPIVAAETGINDACGIATYAISYYELGRQTARMAYKILVEGAKVEEMPVEWAEGDPEISINEAIAAEIGFTIPQEVLDLAA